MTKSKDEILNRSVDTLELSVRASNALKNGHFETIGDVVAVWPNGVWVLKNLGKRSFREIHEYLSEIVPDLVESPTQAHKRKCVIVPHDDVLRQFLVNAKTAWEIMRAKQKAAVGQDLKIRAKKDEWLDLLRMRMQGFSYAEIGRRTSRSGTAIRDRLRRNLRKHRLKVEGLPKDLQEFARKEMSKGF